VELRSFQGVISACLTPNGRYRERIPELVDFHLKHGVRGFFVLGTTGEGVKLSREERAEVAETAVEYVGVEGSCNNSRRRSRSLDNEVACEPCIKDRS
jgi:dihydrodipicolinate synthase/N-acetylneuraminate lyase